MIFFEIFLVIVHKTKKALYHKGKRLLRNYISKLSFDKFVHSSLIVCMHLHNVCTCFQRTQINSFF